MVAARYLYLVRHGEALADESGLSANGRRQAAALGRRLAGRPIEAVHHGPAARAAQTAQVAAAQLAGVGTVVAECAGDYVPHLPERAELPSDSADFLLGFLSWATPEDAATGRALAREAERRFTGPVAGERERHELLVTHNFLVGWLVRHALDAPAWRWLGINQAHTGLTVIRYAPGRPPAVLVHNDQRHLPPDLAWTGFPPEQRI
ncbi:histidine phosphatase family protein [Kitasatospora sp. NPDC088134]|uniref:histidine phosphatase family protein n=1 Tax=Kitasatospora sp. NPDC088134 TaxID=3364071 RepID=UPI0037F984ED